MNKKHFKRKKLNLKRQRVKEFISEVNKIGWETCGCENCRAYHERLYDLSNKIVSNCDISNISSDFASLNEQETKDCVYTFAVEVGRCILHPAYLYENFGNWSPENGNLLPGHRTNALFFLQKIIRNYSSSMTPQEKREFGEAVSSIENLFECPECGSDPEIGSRVKETA